MTNTSIAQKYDKSWRDRLTKVRKETFWDYERNWVLPSLFKHNQKVLDIASGNSIVGEHLVKKFNCHVTAIDISSSALKDAKRRGVKGVIGSVENKLPFASNSFDLVFWGDNIEHIFDPQFALNEIKRVLVPGGRVILSTPNQAYWRYRLYMLVRGALPKTEGDPNDPWEWEHIRFFNRGILQDLLKKVGFVETKFLGVSRRRLDKLGLGVWPELFGMIIVVEATKNAN